MTTGISPTPLPAPLVDDPPGHLRDGGVVKPGFSDALDLLIDENEAAKRWIAGLERREKERTRISSLKVGFNKVFGYYIEVPKSHVRSVPEYYVGKQTLVNGRALLHARTEGQGTAHTRNGRETGPGRAATVRHAVWLHR